MTEQLVIHRHDYDAGNQGLSWARIIGIAFVIALHLTALMMLLIPAVAPKAPAEKERTTMVTLVDAPPPPRRRRRRHRRKTSRRRRSRICRRRSRHRFRRRRKLR